MVYCERIHKHLAIFACHQQYRVWLEIKGAQCKMHSKIGKPSVLRARVALKSLADRKPYEAVTKGAPSRKDTKSKTKVE